MSPQIKTPPVYDISHYEIISDFTKISPKPVLMLTKATQGLWQVDPTFAPYFAGMAQIGCARGAYHFFEKDVNAQAQGTFFSNAVRPHITDKDTLILDVEAGGESVGGLQAWFDCVHQNFPRNRLMIYSRKNILDPLAMTLAQREYFRKIPVWTAGYPWFPDLFNTVPASYTPDQTKWGPVWLWQYTDKGIVEGMTGGVDLNWIAPEFLSVLEAAQAPTEPPQPEEPPAGDVSMETRAFFSGVKEIKGRMFESDYRAVIIPAVAIDIATYKKVAPTLAENVDGDYVCNYSPFDGSYALNEGLRIGGTTFRSYVPWDPFGYWTADKKFVIHHMETTFRNQGTVGQAFRYLIEFKDGRAQKNQNWDGSVGSIDAWNRVEPRRLVGTNAAGDTISITVKGRDAQNRGMSLHECVELGFDLGVGITMLLDADGGESSQDYLLVNGQKDMWRATPNTRIVPVFMVIKLKERLTWTTTPPPPPPPTPTGKAYTLTVEGYKPASGTLEPL